MKFQKSIFFMLRPERFRQIMSCPMLNKLFFFGLGLIAVRIGYRHSNNHTDKIGTDQKAQSIKSIGIKITFMVFTTQVTKGNSGNHFADNDNLENVGNGIFYHQSLQKKQTLVNAIA